MLITWAARKHPGQIKLSPRKASKKMRAMQDRATTIKKLFPSPSVPKGFL